MSQDVVIPDKFRNAPIPAALAHLSPQNESLTEGIGSSYPVISFAGKRWSLRYKGQKRLITYPSVPGQRLPTDGQPSNYIDVIILRKAPNKSKSYYPRNESGASFNPDDVDSHKRPVCASMDGIVPDEGVEKKQSDTCALCPQNEWKMQPHGKMGRACQDRMRLAVIILPSMITPLFGAPIIEPMFLPIPPASLQGLSALGDEMEKNGKHFSHYITRIEFLDKSWPQFRYLVADMVTDAQAPTVNKLREDPMAYRITGESGGPTQPPAQGQMRQVNSQAPPVTGAPVMTPQEAERAARIAAIRGQGADTVQEQKAPQEAPRGFEPQMLELQANPPAEPESSVSEVETSTPEIDDLIASMMPQPR